MLFTYSTLPLIDSITGEFLALEYTEIVLENDPMRDESYFTLIMPLPLVGMGSLLHSGVVQPQDVATLAITRGSLPVFTNSNE